MQLLSLQQESLERTCFLSKFKMRFLLDENVHKGLFKFLKEQGQDVKLSPRTISNGQVFRLAQNEERVLISRDSDFLDESFIGPEHFGILLIRVKPKDLASQQSCMKKLLSEFSEMKGRAFMLLTKDKFEQLEPSTIE